MAKHIFQFISVFSLLSIMVLPIFCLAQGQNKIDKLRINAGRLERRLEKLAEFGKIPTGGVHRLAFSEVDIRSRRYIRSLMKEAGLDVHTDEAGNIIGRRNGSRPDLPPIVFGSHTDTVPSGGKYDGAVGVLGAIECAQVLNENAIQTRHPLEVVVFTDEEGGLVGSRAMNGTLTLKALEVVSLSGKTIREGIRALGGDPESFPKVKREKGSIRAFIEVHIEQGAVLDSGNIDIGVVEGIVGISRWDVTFKGFSNHAGTTPMDMRKDALLAAAHFVIAVNKIVRNEPGRQVGTVGMIKAEPGAPNVIPGRVKMSLELRDLSEDKIKSLFKKIQKEAQTIAEKSGTEVTFVFIDTMAYPAPTDPEIRKYIAESAEQLGLTSLFMPSGAGHDAQDMAKIAPTGMIFVPSIGGISHSPKEFTPMEDIVNGINVLLQTILKIDRDA